MSSKSLLFLGGVCKGQGETLVVVRCLSDCRVRQVVIYPTAERRFHN